MPALRDVETNPRTWASSATPKKKPGPRKKPYKDRKFTASTAIRRQERSYSDEKKEEVIMWLIHHRVQRLGEWKPPSLRDAEKHFKIPKSTIADWNEFRESHISNQQRRYASQWPDLEEKLYSLFLERREKQQIVTTAWFRLKARLAFRELYPDVPWPGWSPDQLVD
ncbi:hypothetical protein CDV31_017330, partial [Fusarium ambrosium]